MRIVIVDDDVIFAEKFKYLIHSKWYSAPTRLDLFPDAESFLKSQINYDVVFLDIEMPGISGMQLAKNFGAQSPVIIFVTHREDLVFEAYNTTNAIGFIRKAFLEEDLNIIIERITRNHQTVLYFNVKCGNAVTKLRYSDVIYIEKIAKDIVLHTESETFTTRKSLTEAEQELAPYGFVRTHAGFLVNLAYVELINPTNALLKNGKSIPISRQKLKLLKDMFLERNVMLNE